MTRVPTSNIAAIPTILMMVKKVMPTSVLDVGIGYGKYGCLIREWLSMEDYLKPKDQWAMRIDGIEVFPQYITPIQQHAYNNIMIGCCFDRTPRCLRNRATDRDFTWKASAAESLSNPFCASGSSLTNQGCSSNWSCHSVIGTTTFSGRMPI